VGFFLFFMVWQPTPAYAQEAWASITCQDESGTQQTFQVGWDNENNYFLDKGNIAQHYCEGGFAGQFTIFVSVLSIDGSELDSALLYHPGYVAPAPVEPELPVEPSPEPTEPPVEIEEPVVEPTPPVEPEPIPTEPVAPIEPSPEPTPEPTVEPTLQPEPSQEPIPTPERPVTPIEAPKPSESPSPSPEPIVPPTSLPEVQIPSEPTPEPDNSVGLVLAFEAVGKLINNLRLIGSDMTPEVREQAQQVVVASVIVTQIALAGRKP
jgi:hypothetical protein